MATTLPAPRPRLGRYELVCRLATGGMAEIFLALEAGPGGLVRTVVLKRILPHLAADPEFVDLFLREARIAARLSHPNVVHIHELGEADGQYFLVLEWVRGVTVRRLASAALERGRVIPVGAALSIAMQACEGAHAAHELCDAEGHPLGVVHRDISPPNLMVADDGHVKLLDFGIAKETATSEATRTGGVKGKLEYLSPEQARQDPLDRRADVFALGITAWELLAGRKLFKRETDFETMQAVDEAHVPDLRSLRLEVPPEVAQAIGKALAREPADRWASADEFRRALAAAAARAGVDCGHDRLAAFLEEVLGRDLREEVAALESSLRTPSAPRTPPLPHAPSEGTPGPGERTVPDRVEARARARGRRRRARRVGAWTTALVALVALVGWLSSRPDVPAAPPLEGPPIVTGFAPSSDAAVVLAELEPLRTWLERRLGRPMRFEVAKSYDDLAAHVRSGEYHFGSFPAFLLLRTRDREPALRPLAISLFDGSAGNNGLLLVPENSPVQSLRDLRGRRLCLTDTESTTGYVLPRAALRRAGVDPDRDLAAVHLCGNHLQAMREVVAGTCDAVATYDKAYLAGAAAGVPSARLRIVAATGKAPNDTWCAGPGTAEADAQRLREALLAFQPLRDTGAPLLGRVLRISGFLGADDATHDPLRKALGMPAPPRAAPRPEARSETGP